MGGCDQSQENKKFKKFKKVKSVPIKTYQKVITMTIMTFWYIFRNGLNFLELFKFYFHLGLITTPHVLYVHMTYVYSLSLMFFCSHDHMAKRSHYCIMIFFDFGVLLYGRTLTLISLLFLHNPTTPILAIDILVIWADLEEC